MGGLTLSQGSLPNPSPPRHSFPAPGSWSTCIALWHTQHCPDTRLQWAWGRPLSKTGSFSVAASLLSSALVLGSHLPVERKQIYPLRGEVTPCCTPWKNGHCQGHSRQRSHCHCHFHTATPRTLLTWPNSNRQIMSTAKSLRCHILERWCRSLRATDSSHFLL